MDIYIRPIDGKSGSAAVYALLEYAWYLKTGEKLPGIEKTPNGKPYFPDRHDAHFSLSHARTHVLCALSGHPVGVDVESARPVSDRVTRYFCLPGELDSFEPLDLWVLKESYLKMLGGTLVDVKKIRFSRQGHEIISSDRNALIKLYRIGECHAAVSSLVEAPPDTITLV